MIRHVTFPKCPTLAQLGATGDLLLCLDSESSPALSDLSARALPGLHRPVMTAYGSRPSGSPPVSRCYGSPPLLETNRPVSPSETPQLTPQQRHAIVESLPAETQEAERKREKTWSFSFSFGLFPL